MDKRSNEEKRRGIRAKQARNLKMQIDFYDEERDEAEWALYKHIFTSAAKVSGQQQQVLAPPAPPAPPAAAGLPAPPPPPPPVAEE